MPLRALIFDVDGTLAETEETHRAAFNLAFAEAGRSWDWTVDIYRDLLRVTGGQRRIRHYVDMIGGEVTAQDIAVLHARKNALYADMLARGGVVLRPGVARLIDEARGAGLRLAIATTTSRSNFDALLTHLFAPGAASWFDAIITGEDVVAKKPDPEAYALALAALDLDAAACVAFEDSYNGLLAAAACGIPTVATPSCYTAHEQFTGASLVRADLNHPAPVDLPVLRAIAEARADRQP